MRTRKTLTLGITKPSVAQRAKCLKFMLTEDGNLVRALLAIGGAVVLDFRSDQPHRVNVRHPKASERELLKMAEYWPQPEQRLKDSPAAVLDAYIGSREGDVVKEVLVIRKALRKIAGAMRNANVARRAGRVCRSDA